MDEEEKIAKKPKLNIFQKMKKRSVMRNATEEQYISGEIPNYLFGDIDVICSIVKRTPEFMLRLSKEQKKAVIERVPEIFNKLPQKLMILKSEIISNFPEYIATIFDSMSSNDKFLVIQHYPEYIARIPLEDAKTYILSNMNDYSLEYRKMGAQCIKYLPKEFQFKLLTEDIKYFDNRHSNNIKKIDPMSFINFLDGFDQEVVINAVEFLLEEAKKQDAYYWQDKKKKVPLLSNMIISNLPIETQIKIVTLDNDYIEKMSVEAALELSKQNPMIFDKLSIEAKANLIEQRPEFYNILSSEDRRNIDGKYGSMLTNISEDNKVARGVIFRHSFKSNDVESVKKAILKINEAGYEDLIENYCYDEKMFEEIARFNPSILRVSEFHRSAMKIINASFKAFKNQTNNPEILEELGRLEKNPIDITSRNTMLCNLAKVLLNKKVMSTVDPKLIVAYIRNQSMEDLKEIVKAAYGDKALQILNDRPWLRVELVPNLDIFDNSVIEKFGIGTVHSFFTYYSSSPMIMGDLARNPEELNQFELFSKICRERFDDSPSNLDKQLTLFMNNKELFNQIDFANLTDKQKGNLLLMVNDSSMTLRENESACIQLKNMEDLDHYEEKRNKMYDKKKKIATSANDLKDAITRRFFGIPYYAEYCDSYISNKISARELMNIFNLESFISDERTNTSELFTKNELDLLELISIIAKIRDVNVLKDIYKALSEKEKEVINPLDFGRTKEKVPEQYSQELIDSLLTVEQAKNRAASGENGISYIQEEDGQEIIELSGADFRMLIHSTAQEMTNSNVGVPSEENIVDIWNNFEDGISTISGCVIEGGMLYSCHGMDPTHGINLGFCTVPAKQILGMSHMDAHVTHARRALNPLFEYGKVKFNYPDELVRKTAAQITGMEEKDPNHPYNEVAMLRNNIHTQEIEEHSFGGKVMPDYIVAYGGILPRHRDAAKRFGKNGKPLPIIVIDIEKYRYTPRGPVSGKIYERVHKKEDHTIQRDSGPIVQEVKDMLEK